MSKQVMKQSSKLLQIFISERLEVLGSTSTSIRGEHILVQGTALRNILTLANNSVERLAERLSDLRLVVFGDTQTGVALGYKNALDGQSFGVSDYTTCSHGHVHHTADACFLQLCSDDKPVGSVERIVGHAAHGRLCVEEHEVEAVSEGRGEDRLLLFDGIAEHRCGAVVDWMVKEFLHRLVGIG